MLFFEAQRKARSKTGWLVFIFICNVTLMSLLNAVLAQAFVKTPGVRIGGIVFSVSVLFFLLMSIVATLTLPKGVALVESLGGKLIDSASADLKEKQFINVVEEMSLASGVPIPHCAVLEQESAINAFVAGERIHEIVVTVTRGALENLTRDELQAVIGHEFSHILNEDLSLNGKLAGVVQGFQILTKIGDILSDRRGRGTSSSRNSAGGFGFGLMVVGSVGYAFGRFTQSMISRQREYLADASSAQYTRNPEALARALGKILLGQGSALRSSSRYEFAHIFFSDSVGTSFVASLFATHPPLRDRIQKLAPRTSLDDVLAQASATLPKPSAEDAPTATSKQQWTAEKVLNCIGAPGAENFYLVSSMLGKMSAQQESLKRPEIARAALSLVVLHSQPEYLEELPHVSEISGVGKSDLLEIRNSVEAGEQQRVLVFQLSLGTLRFLSYQEKDQLLQSLRALFERDHKWSLLETMLYLVAEKTLLPGKVAAGATQPSISSLLAWFRKEDDVEFSGVQDFLQGWERAPLLKKKELVQESLKAIDLQKAESREEFRLMALWLGVPVPAL